MPRIQEYTPETSASGPVGGVAPNLEQASAYGRGIQSFGRDIAEAGDLLQRRQEQAEVSDASASASDARSMFSDRIFQETQDGTINPNKINSDYQDYVDSESEKFNTPAGKNAFVRQSQRLGGMIAYKATKASGVVAANNAIGDFQKTVTNNTNTIQKDPDQFHDVMSSFVEQAHHMTEVGTLTGKQTDQAILHAGKEYSVAALRGYMDVDPDNAEAQLKSGRFDDFLDSDGHKQMMGEIKMARVAGEVESKRVAKLADDEQSIIVEQWQQGMISKYPSLNVPTKEILKSPMSAQEKITWIKMSEQSTKKKNTADPAVMNDINERILLPDDDPRKIKDPSQLQALAANGDIGAAEYHKGLQWLDKSPQGQALRTNRKQVMDIAKSTLVSGNAMQGIKDPDGQRNLADFQGYVQQQEALATKEGRPVSSLYDPQSKDYLGNKVQMYQKTPQQIMQRRVENMRAQNQPTPLKKKNPKLEEMDAIVSKVGK